jgi:hypothetical protein
MSEIIVTATRSEFVRSLESPAAARTDTAVAADRAAGRVAVDLLRDAPGVHVQQTSAGQGAVVLRGLVGTGAARDGIPLNNGTIATPDTSPRSTREHRADRVVRGPASVRWLTRRAAINDTRPHPPGRHEPGGAPSVTEPGRARFRGYGTATWQAARAALMGTGDLRAGARWGRQPTGFDAWGMTPRLRPSGAHHVTVGVQRSDERRSRYDRYWDYGAGLGDCDPVRSRRQLGYLARSLRTPRSAG